MKIHKTQTDAHSSQTEHNKESESQSVSKSSKKKRPGSRSRYESGFETWSRSGPVLGLGQGQNQGLGQGLSSTWKHQRRTFWYLMNLLDWNRQGDMKKGIIYIKKTAKVSNR